MFVYLRLLNYLSRPDDPKAAKEKGLELAQLTGKTIIAVVAHPDDIDWYAGGTLDLLKKHGNRVIVVVATSGEKGGNGVPNLGEIREQEQLAAAKILGLDEIIFLKHPDRGLKDDEKFRAELEDIFSKYSAEILFTFDIEKESYIYHHPDHRAAGKAAIEVSKNSPTIKSIYLFHSKKPNIIFNVSQATEDKAKALGAHLSQRDPKNRPINFLFKLFPFRIVGSNQDFREVGVSQAEIFRNVENRNTSNFR